MQYQRILPPLRKLDGSLQQPTILRQPIFRGKEIFCLDTTPTWHLSRVKLVELAQKTLKNSKATTCLSGYCASLIYGLPTFNQAEKIEIIYVNSARPANSRVGKVPNLDSQQTVPIRRRSREYPPEAIIEKTGIRVLRWDYLCLELLKDKDPYRAFVSANALIRNVIQCNRHTQVESLKKLTDVQKHLRRLVDEVKMQKYRVRVSRRIYLLNPLCESVLESITDVAFHQLGQTAQAQVEVKHASGSYWIDFVWKPTSHSTPPVGIECDGREKEELVGYWNSQELRELILTERGFRIIRFDSNQIMRPDFPWELAKALGIQKQKRLRRI